jgi:hypothetical protein
MQLTREELLMKLVAARDQSRTAWRPVVVEVAAEHASFSYRLDRQARSREGGYLLGTNFERGAPAARARLTPDKGGSGHGGTAGIGRGMALSFAAAGADVARSRRTI